MSEFKKRTQFLLDEELYHALLNYQDKNKLTSLTSAIKHSMREFFFNDKPKEKSKSFRSTVNICSEQYRNYKLRLNQENNNLNIKDAIGLVIEQFYNKVNIDTPTYQLDNMKARFFNKDISFDRRLTMNFSWKHKEMIDEICKILELDINILISGIFQYSIMNNIGVLDSPNENYLY